MGLTDSCETGPLTREWRGRAGRVFRCVWAQGRNNTRLEWAVGCKDIKGMTPQPSHTRMNSGASVVHSSKDKTRLSAFVKAFCDIAWVNSRSATKGLLITK